MPTKECVICNAEFEPTRKDRKYCTERCSSKAARDRNRAKLPPKKCLFCNEDVNRSRRYQYCKDECFKAAMNERSKAWNRNRVRKRHAELPPLHCKRCETQLKPTLRNYHQLEFCPPCRVLHSEESKKQYYEENKEHLNADNKKRHAIRMQDPEYREQRRLASKQRRIDNPVMIECAICNKVFQKIRGRKTCSPKCSKKLFDYNTTTYNAKIEVRVTNRMRNSIRKCIGPLGNPFDFLEYTVEELIAHLESQFTKKNGCTWDNMDEWHIDHTRPVSSFNFDSTDHPDFKKCWALNNLEPMKAIENKTKGNKWDGVVNA
jgi:hypothetical protein